MVLYMVLPTQRHLKIEIIKLIEEAAVQTEEDKHHTHLLPTVHLSGFQVILLTLAVLLLAGHLTQEGANLVQQEEPPPHGQPPQLILLIWILLLL